MMDNQPSSPAASRRMAKVRQKGTTAELRLRKELFHIGLRYRVNYKILEIPRRTVDIAFPRQKLAIFVDGCFWHGCPEHGSWPKLNAEFWREKINTNRIRDVDTDTMLRALGWNVMRVWEHEVPGEVARRIAELMRK